MCILTNAPGTCDAPCVWRNPSESLVPMNSQILDEKAETQSKRVFRHHTAELENRKENWQVSHPLENLPVGS